MHKNCVAAALMLPYLRPPRIQHLAGLKTRCWTPCSAARTCNWPRPFFMNSRISAFISRAMPRLMSPTRDLSSRPAFDAWLNSRRREDDRQRWLLRRSAMADFHGLLGKTRSRLSQTFASQLSKANMREKKQETIHTLREEYSALVAGQWIGRDWFGAWIASDINNASLALFENYEGGVCAFSRLFETAAEDFSKFHRLAKNRAESDQDDRKSWLGESCSDIASASDL